MRSMLIVDDEAGVRLSLQAVFDREFRVTLATDGPSALEAARQRCPDIAIIDLMMPGMTGLELLPLLKQEDAALIVIVLSAVHDVPKVVEAIRLGADQYLTKPFDVNELRLAVQMAFKHHGRKAEICALAAQLSRWYDIAHVVGQSPPWQETLAVAERAAAARDTTVMLLGESGTGKELLARLVHAGSPRAGAPMIPIHCAAIPEALLESELFGHEKGSFTGAGERRHGCVEMADGGTLFLDEIGEMPLAMQSKLLRFLQDHEFMRVGGREILHADVRVIAATNRNLKDGIREGWFREDLYYRLNVVPLLIPPLRERHGDIPLLVQHYVDGFGRERRARLRSVSPQAMQLLDRYPWPGNVRELRNVIERAVVLYGEQEALQPEHLPKELAGVQAMPASADGAAPVRFPVSLAEETAQLEKRLIQAAIEAAGGNMSQAAVLLQTTRRILTYKTAHYGL